MRLKTFLQNANRVSCPAVSLKKRMEFAEKIGAVYTTVFDIRKDRSKALHETPSPQENETPEVLTSINTN